MPKIASNNMDFYFNEILEMLELIGKPKAGSFLCSILKSYFTQWNWCRP